MAKQKKDKVEKAVVLAKKGDKVAVTTDRFKGAKAKGTRHEVASVIVCHGRKFYRIKGEKGYFHLAPSSCAPVKVQK